MHKDSDSKLGVICVGMGAVATTLIAGIELIRQGKKTAVGSLTQLERFTRQKAPETENTLSNLLKLTPLTDIEFAGFDLIETNALEAAQEANVLSREDLDDASQCLSSIPIWPGIFEADHLPDFEPKRTLSGSSQRALIEQVQQYIQQFLKDKACSRAVVVLTSSTEATLPIPQEAETNHLEGLSPTLLYTIAALELGFPVINATPNPITHYAPIQEFMKSPGCALAGGDLRSGQTFLKATIANAIRERLLGVQGWYSTNILGNRDGRVLDNNQCFATKEKTKKDILESIFDSEKFPQLYSDIEHQVNINYYPPKGDQKEAWDSIQLSGWLGYDMDLKINFQCRDSILASPLVLDLILLTDAAVQRKESGILDWLAPYFKAPIASNGRLIETMPVEQNVKLREKLQQWIDGS